MNERGSVSVLVLIVCSAMLLAFGILVELSRLYTAQNRLELAVKSAARTVLAGYVRELREYGLFAWKGEENQLATVRAESSALLADMLAEDGSPGWSGATLQTHSVRVMPLQSLGQHHVFRQQLLEHMKYKAPAAYAAKALEAAQLVKPAAEQGRIRSEHIKELYEIAEKREWAMEQALNTAERLADQVLALSGAYRSHIASAAGEKPDYSSGDRDAVRFETLLAIHQELNERLAAARQTDNRLHAYAERELAANADAQLGDLGPLGDDYFRTYSSDAAELAARFGMLRSMWSSRQPAERLAEANASMGAAASEWITRLRRTEQSRRDRIERRKSGEAEQRREADRQLEAIWNQPLRNACKSDSRAHYSALAGFADKYRSVNELPTSGAEPVSNVPDSAAGHDGFESLRRLAAVLDAVIKLRNNLYVNEYALTSFNNRTVERSNRVLTGQEAEFILYGIGSCEGNIAAAYTELLALRVAVRTTEEWLKPAKNALLTPMGAFWAALAQGARRAASDLDLLLEGESVELADAMPALKLSYSDYLRLFYALHGQHESILTRMQSVIELNSGQDVTKRYAAVDLYAKASVRLPFVPRLGNGGNYDLASQASDYY